MEPVFIDDLAALEPAEAPRQGFSFTTVHTDGTVGIAVQSLAPGGVLEAHRHDGMWDYFVGLGGSARVGLRGGDGADSEVRVRAGSLLAIPPGTVHRAFNDSTDPFVYLLFQAPFDDDDYVVVDS